MRRSSLVLVALLLVALTRTTTASNAAAGVALSPLHVIPRPRSATVQANCSVGGGAILTGLLRARLDAGGLELVRERWAALGIAPAPQPLPVSVALRSTAPEAASAPAAAEHYVLDVAARGVRIESANAQGQFDALATLAQLAAENEGLGRRIPCVHVEDAPALRWRMLSDDVSRGPLPTMRYFEERIRTLAAFKFNGYSPYMEHVFADPKHPLPAPLDGITPQQLGALARYAQRFHVAFVPEQQTFAHMHNTLKYERYAALAETPHGYLLTPANPAGAAYVRDLISDELAAVPRPPFFHIGSDEPFDLGRGRSQALVAARGEGAVYARHVIDVANFVIAQGGGRPLVWSDALARHPDLFGTLPKALVFVNWHYGSEPTYRPYIDQIVHGGFEQLLAPGALNWNRIYPDLDEALTNIGRFVSEGKAAHVLGLFQTVWHDDGETLFEATWYPVVFAGASAWEEGPVDRARYARDFPAAFFGTDDVRYGTDLAALARCSDAVRHNPRESSDSLFWADPFAPELANVASLVDVPALRLSAEDVLAHLRSATPPLHGNAAAVMFLAASRYDALGREYQIAPEARALYDDARRNAQTGKGSVERGLLLARYLFWEQRDTMLALEPLVRAAWEYEDRQSHEASVLERYRIAADRALARADRLNALAAVDGSKKRLPEFDAALGIEALP